MFHIIKSMVVCCIYQVIFRRRDLTSSPIALTWRSLSFAFDFGSRELTHSPTQGGHQEQNCQEFFFRFEVFLNSTLGVQRPLNK